MKHTAETKQKLSEMRKGSRNPFFGHKHTDEAKHKMSNWTRSHNLNTRQYELEKCSISISDTFVLGYLAGVIDGEGSITLKRDRPVITVYNTCVNMIDWLHIHVGGKVRNNTDRRGRLPMHEWTVAATKDVYYLCKILYPYLKVKNKEAFDVVILLESKYGEKLND